jgi:hypothetical protein
MSTAQVAHAKRLTNAVRCADREYLITNFDLVRVAERRRSNTIRHLFELQQGDIRLNIRADNVSHDRLAIRKFDDRNIRGLHYVRCG